MTRPIYRFGNSVIDVAARQMRSAGKPVEVPAKVFDCLVYLIQQRGRAVGHDELIAAVWGKTEISESLLRQTIRRVRSVLEGTGDQQGMLRTVPGFGYQFTADDVAEDGKSGVATEQGDQHAEVTESATGDASTEPAHPQVSATTAPRPSRLAWRRHRRVALLALTLIVAVTAGWLLHERRSAPTPPSMTPSVDAAAVLPVTVSTTDQAWSWVRLGLMDLLATRLRSGGQVVVPSESVAALASGRATKDVARAVRSGTGARYLIAPTAQRTDTEWVVHLTLHQPNDGDREVEARDGDLVVAGRRAADQLLTLLGKSMPADRIDSEDARADQVLAQIRSALLRDDVMMARRLIETAPEALSQSADIRFLRADMDVRTGKFQDAQKQLESLLGETQSEKDPVLRSRVLNGLGLVAIRREQPERAVRHLGEAIALVENRNEPLLLGNAYNTRGMAYARQSQHDLASADFARSRLASEISGNMQLLALIDTNEGLLAISRNQPGAALPLFEQAAERNERLGNPSGLALASAYKIWIHLVLLEPDKALAIYEHVVPKLHGLENPIGTISIEFSGASALQGNGRLSEARSKLEQLAEHPHVSLIIGVVRDQQALIEFEMGRLEPALTFAKQAVDLLTVPDDAYTRAQAWLVVVRALRGLNRPTDADKALKEFSAWADGVDNAAAHASARLAGAEQAWSQHRHEEAIGLYDDALRIAIGEGIPADIATVVTSYGATLIGDGRLDRASAVVGQVARWSERDFACAMVQAHLYRALGQREAWQAALDRARRLAGERPIPASIAAPPLDVSLGTPGSPR